MSKFAKLLVIGCLAAIVAAGCSTKNEQNTPTSSVASSTAGASETPKLEKVDLTLLLAGDQPPQQAEVLAEINKRSEQELNINLKVQYIPWADYQEKIKVMAAGGASFDIYLDFFGNLSSAAARKQAIPLNELLDNYGQDLKKVIPQAEFNGLSIDGQIYGIPAIYPRAELGAGVIIRKDLREKYGFPEITTLVQLEQYLDAVKKNEPGMTPLVANQGRFGSVTERELYNGKVWFTWGSDTQPPFTIDIYSKPYKVVNNFETDGFKQTMNWGRKAYSNGWFARDILMEKNDQTNFTSGKAGAVTGDLFSMSNMVPQLEQNIPGAKLELVMFKKDMPLTNLTPTNNYSSISATSAHPERAMMFLNWLLKNQENYDLFMYGIEGKHYTLKGDLVELPADTDLANRPYNPTPWFIYNTAYHRALTTDPAEFTEAFQFWKTAEIANNPLMNFSFNAEPVKTEYAQIQKVVQELAMPVMTGVVQSDDDYQKLLDQLNKAGMQKVLAEAQKQLDEYIADNNIQ
ncbi:extracellular solute-binding protein [Paenibacillus sp. PAMC21692]|uniref:extracellular solute-binding protein n=1 Tax=Paenibacillus sp. PAMC21692 TaxID=2762320 RepID=UPI0021C2C778|nr:extracellular solute-binding protein [Paenibacillus sp. PAMC21692]